MPFCQTIFKCLILISSQKAYLKNTQSFHPHSCSLWHNVVITTWQLLKKQNITMENLKLLRVNFLKLEFSKPIQGPSWAPVGSLKLLAFLINPRIFFQREMKISILLNPIKHIPLPHPDFILLSGCLLKFLCSTYGCFLFPVNILHSPTF